MARKRIVKKAPMGMFRIIGNDEWMLGDWVEKDCDDREEAFRIADKRNKWRKSYMDDSYVVYNDSGDRIREDTDVKRSNSDIEKADVAERQAADAKKREAAIYADDARGGIIEAVSMLLGIIPNEITEETSLQPQTEAICGIVTHTIGKTVVRTEKMTVGDLFEQFGV